MPTLGYGGDTTILAAFHAVLEQVVEAIVRTERDTEVERVFVDLMEVATGVDEALEVAHRILKLCGGQ